MLDIKLLHSDFDYVHDALSKKGVDPELIKTLKKVSEALKASKTALETAQAKQNELSKQFGIYKKEGKEIAPLKQELDSNKETIANNSSEVKALEEELNALAFTIPNLPDSDVPFGNDEAENVDIKKVLDPKHYEFQPKEHWELAETSGWINFEKGVKLAQSRFSVLCGEGARVERALVNFMLDFNRKRGFQEVSVPVLVNQNALFGTGQLPKFEEDLYKTEGEDLYLIPTAEVPLTNLYQDEIIVADLLPIKMTGFTPCFRKEAGSAGKDTRGMIRQHQFYKVELVSITKPEQSDTVFDEMLQCASDMLSELGLPHKLVMLCSGDLGFSAAKTIDIEVWLPGQGRYREISSVSNTRSFQARRAKIRYKENKKNNLVHTLNGSSLAVGRTLIAIMENYQNQDGTIAIPEALKAYL